MRPFISIQILKDCWNGAYVIDSDNVTIDANVFDGLKGGKGIRVEGDNHTIINNVFRNSNYQLDDFENSLHAEIYATTGDNTIIRNNHLYGNVNVDYGVMVVAGTDASVAHNTITGYQTYGISLLLAGVTSARLRFNDLYGNVADIQDVGTGTIFEHITGSTLQPKNLRGRVVISDTAQAANVVLPTAEANNLYYTTASVGKATGVAADGAYVARIVSKTTTGFTVALNAAPGAGISVTVDWILVR